MAQRTPAKGFTDTGIEKAAARSASAGKNNIRDNLRNPRLKILFVSEPVRRSFLVRRSFSEDGSEGGCLLG